MRVVFIPLFVMCVYPASGPALAHPAWPCLLSLLMGVTNGYFGSVPMIQAAGKVPPEQRELAGELTFATLASVRRSGRRGGGFGESAGTINSRCNSKHLWPEVVKVFTTLCS